MRNYKINNHGTEQKIANPQHLSRNRRWHRRKGVPWLLRDTSGGSSSSGGGSSDWGSECSSHQLTMTKGSGGSNSAGRTGRGLRVKVSLPIFKDEKTKDAMTYLTYSWWWDIVIFCCFGWDDLHLLLYIFQSLQEFPRDLARSLGEDILQMLDEHYGMVMTFDALSNELYSLNKGPGRMWLSSECACCNRFR